VEDRIVSWIDILTPIRELSYVYPLLIINWLNWVLSLAFSPIFFEPSRFDGVLAIAYSLAIIIGLVRLVRARRAS
jgi:hypothetical protein